MGCSGSYRHGTGYYYPPVVIPGPVPIFYPYPYTYAGSVWYNPSTGAWARGGTIYGPYGGVAKGGTYYNPTTGAWTMAADAASYGPQTLQLDGLEHPVIAVKPCVAAVH